MCNIQHLSYGSSILTSKERIYIYIYKGMFCFTEERDDLERELENGLEQSSSSR
jgi:hypothetical protein